MKCYRMMAFAIGSSIMLSGCITSTSYQYESSQGKATCTKAMRRIVYTLQRTTRNDGGRFDEAKGGAFLQGAWAAPQYANVALMQFRENFKGLASDIREEGKDHTTMDYDIKLKIHVQNSFNKAVQIPAFISGLSLFIIPSWGDDSYTLCVEALGANGLTKTYRLEANVTTIVWLPFALARPFVDMPAQCVETITSANWRELRTRMENDGFFDDKK